MEEDPGEVESIGILGWLDDVNVAAALAAPAKGTVVAGAAHLASRLVYCGLSLVGLWE